jgi:hypothetical protein
MHEHEHEIGELLHEFSKMVISVRSATERLYKYFEVRVINVPSNGKHDVVVPTAVISESVHSDE